MNNPPNPNVPINLLTNPTEIKTIVKTLPSKKAPGEDKILNILLKKLPSKSYVQLSYILNSITKLQYFPNNWKKSIVIPVKKPNKKGDDPKSYRPISLLNCMSKLYEKILLKRIDNFMEENEILPEEQFGFRKSHGSLHHPVRIVNEAIEDLNKRRPTAIVAFDFEKAFDRVWHHGLIYKMISLKFPAEIIKIIYSFFSNRSYRVKINNTFSIPLSQEAGVPQGSVLSPVLYNIFVHDIPKFHNNKIALFADDLAIISSSFSPFVAQQKVKNQFKSLTDYTKKWRLSLNADKTQYTIISKRTIQITVPVPLSLQDYKIPLSNQLKYLGIVIDQRLTFRKHALSNIKNSFIAMKSLYSLLISPKFTLENKKLLYKSVIRPILTHGAPLMNNIAECHIKKLQVIQNKCLRHILGKGRYTKIVDLHNKADIIYVHEYINKLSKNFYEKTIDHDSLLIKNITKRRRDNTPIHKHCYLHERLELYNSPWDPGGDDVL